MIKESLNSNHVTSQVMCFTNLFTTKSYKWPFPLFFPISMSACTEVLIMFKITDFVAVFLQSNFIDKLILYIPNLLSSPFLSFFLFFFFFFLLQFSSNPVLPFFLSLSYFLILYSGTAIFFFFFSIPLLISLFQ